MRVDLYLGSDIGRWVLRQVPASQIGAVYTQDADLTREVPRGIPLGGDPRGQVALSVHYARVLTPVELARYEAAYNLHLSYLPWGKGWWAVFWAIYADEPAGATLHRMTERVDAGPIVDQRRVEVLPNDTGGSLLARVRAAERGLFREWWPRLPDLPQGTPQQGPGSKHSRAEVEALRRLDDARIRGALDFG